MRVDIHTHILPPEIPKFKEQFGYGGFIQLIHDHKNCCADMVDDSGKFFRKIESNCFDPKKREEDLKRNRVDIQVISTVPVMFSYWAKPKDGLEVAQFLNDHIAQTVETNPKKFIGLGTIPMQAPELAVGELNRIKKLGLAGIQIGTHVNGWNLDDENLFPVYEACEKLDLAVFVHPWDMMSKEKMPKYFLPWLVGMPAETSLAVCSLIFGGVFEKFPKIRFAFAHGGGAFPFTFGRIQHGFDVRPDLCAKTNPHPPKKYLGHFYLDSLLHDQKSLDLVLNLVGKDRICLGTDYPFPLGELTPGKLIEESGLPKEDQDRIFGQNAFDWLGLDRKNYE